MSLPTVDELKRLNGQLGDDEGYHAEFDILLEDKLLDLDREWLEAMRDAYRASGLSRWYA